MPSTFKRGLLSCEPGFTCTSCLERKAEPWQFSLIRNRSIEADEVVYIIEPQRYNIEPAGHANELLVPG
jgi:hypothetical protein